MENFNSTTNQEIKGTFVGREIKACVSNLVEFVLNTGSNGDMMVNDAPFTTDDIANMYFYPEHIGTYAKFKGGTEEEKDKETERLQDLISLHNDLMNDESGEETDNQGLEDINEKIQSEIEELENLNQESKEIYEWYVVSNYLGEKLEKKGEPTINDGYTTYWGRTTSGQAILLDHVISEICSDMEILDGQKSSWAK